MSLATFATRLGVASSSTAYQLEQAESDGGITLKRLRVAANALGCDVAVVLDTACSADPVRRAARDRKGAGATTPGRSQHGDGRPRRRRARYGRDHKADRPRDPRQGRFSPVGINNELPFGATPVDPDEAEGLIPSISTRGQLNAFEALNIAEALGWAHGNKKIHRDQLSIETLRLLHKRMFNKTWRWAGAIRITDKSIGVARDEILPGLSALTDDVKVWLDFRLTRHERFRPGSITGLYKSTLSLTVTAATLDLPLTFFANGRDGCIQSGALPTSRPTRIRARDTSKRCAWPTNTTSPR